MELQMTNNPTKETLKLKSQYINKTQDHMIDVQDQGDTQYSMIVILPNVLNNKE